MSALAPALPLVLALAAGTLQGALGRAPLAVRQAVAAGALALNLALALALVVLADRGATLALGIGGGAAVVALQLVLDRLAAWMLLITATVALLGSAYACGVGADREWPRFHACVQFQLLGLQGCLLAADLCALFLFAELAVVASCALAARGRGAGWPAAGRPLVVVQLAGSALFLGGIGCVAAALGSTGYAALGAGVPVTPALAAVRTGGGVLVLAALALKAMLLPFAGWRARQRTPTVPLVLLIAAGAYALLRVDTLILPCIGGGPCGPLPAVVPLGLGTLGAGALGVLALGSVRLLAFRLLLFPFGWLLIAAGSGRDLGFTAAVYGLAHAVVAGTALCLATDLVARSRDTRPALALLYAGAAGGIVGMPPLSGFMARLAILGATLADALVVWSIVLVASLAGLIAVVRAVGRLWRNAPRSLATARGAARRWRRRRGGGGAAGAAWARGRASLRVCQPHRASDRRPDGLSRRGAGVAPLRRARPPRAPPAWARSTALSSQKVTYYVTSSDVVSLEFL